MSRKKETFLYFFSLMSFLLGPFMSGNKTDIFSFSILGLVVELPVHLLFLTLF